jgi:hypothetical protein
MEYLALAVAKKYAACIKPIKPLSFIPPAKARGNSIKKQDSLNSHKFSN